MVFRFADETFGSYVLILCCFNNKRKAISDTAAYRVGKVQFAVLSVLSIAIEKIQVLRLRRRAFWLINTDISETFSPSPSSRYEFSVALRTDC